MNFGLRLPHVGVAVTLNFLSLPNNNLGFMQTSSLLAWSNAPGASLQQLSTQFSPRDVLFNAPAQLPLAQASRPFCPSGSSSLLIFVVSSRNQRSGLENAFLSNQIKQDFNSVPEPSRFHTDHFPSSLVDLWTSELPTAWSSLCEGDVILKELLNDENINTVFHEAIRKIQGPRLVIMTSNSPTFGSGVLDAKMTNRKRHLPSMITKNTDVNPRGIPPSTTGVFWRYSFLSDYLIIGTLVMVLLFIPPVILGSFALQSIEPPKGLKTKMVGQVSEAKAN